MSADNSDVVARLRSHYAAWWESVAPQIEAVQRVIIGHDAEPQALLSPCEWRDVFLDQGEQVRRGVRSNGVWHVEAARGGTYEFELRRWPRECGAALTAGLPAAPLADGERAAGRALSIAAGRLRAAGPGGTASFDETRDAAASDQAVTFRVELPAGPIDLQTWFLDGRGAELCGAYYVYVSRLAPE